MSVCVYVCVGVCVCAVAILKTFPDTLHVIANKTNIQIYIAVQRIQIARGLYVIDSPCITQALHHILSGLDNSSLATVTITHVTLSLVERSCFLPPQC